MCSQKQRPHDDHKRGVEVLFNSHTKIEIKYSILASKILYKRPNVGWNAISVRRYALPYHDTSSSLWKSLVMVGIAVARGEKVNM